MVNARLKKNSVLHDGMTEILRPLVEDGGATLKTSGERKLKCN